MVDINRIIALIDKYLEATGLNRVEANEISIYLEKNGALNHSTKGQPLRKLLREGKIPNAEQPGGKGTAWYIRHSNIKADVPSKSMQPLAPRKIKIDQLKSIAISEGLEPVADSKSEILILGTLPGKLSLRTQQYYADSRNYLWRIISSIFNEIVPNSYEGKLLMLKRYNIALWDVLKSANRESSLDADIKNPDANDILGFISTHPNLRVIGLNGKDAYNYLVKYIGLSIIPTNIRVVILPSTSSSNTHKTLDEKITQWKVIIN